MIISLYIIILLTSVTDNRKIHKNTQRTWKQTNSQTNLISVQSMLRSNQIIFNAINLFWDYQTLETLRQKYKIEAFEDKNEAVQKLFWMALEINPSRMDFLYGIAFFMILQNKIQQAVSIYGKIYNQYPSAFDAGVLEAVYTKIAFGNVKFEEKIKKLRKINQGKVNEALKYLSYADKIIEEKSISSSGLNQLENHCIVICGLALRKNGSMQPDLIKRLKKAIQIYASIPNSKILVTGGIVRSGRTQSFMMMYWLFDKGIPKEDIIIEDQSKDTVENAIMSISLLKKYGFKDITIITNAEHSYRAFCIFSTAYQRVGLNVNLSMQTVGSFPSQVQQLQKVAIVRDILRTIGYWAIPGIFQ